MQALMCASMADTAPSIADLIAAQLPERGARRPFVLGIAGAQGSGKSTVARELAIRLGCPVLSLDDLYLDGAARRTLAAEVHPLLATRGVPGTHDPARGLRVIEALAKPETTLLPRFDKARDEPAPPEPWQGPANIVILEGWCLGARPQPEDELVKPLNALEAERDPDGIWRHWVNARLANYRALFERIDLLVFLAAPDFEIVGKWRAEQEHALKRARGEDAGMSATELATFIQHYQRLTEHMLRHGREWADMTIALNAKRRAVGVSR
ncbi:kinase [Sphingomonas sp.]|uniref:kinase n=1 Tax=Sphingomonas sp. TaxID=28214 RepID=UPI0025F397B4|nr:kinase [Sphingomonas sp.]